jgi:outer membrane protein assembly factor BamB
MFAIHQDNPPQNRIDAAWRTLGGDFGRTGLSELNGPLVGYVKWCFDTQAAAVSSVTVGFGGRTHVACDAGALYTLGKFGEPVWVFEAGRPFTSAATVGPEGSVYVGDEAGRLYAIDRNGQLRWTFDMAGAIYSAPVVTKDGQLYVCSADGTMRALDADGTEMWKAQVCTPDGMTGAVLASPSLGADGTIYIGGAYDPSLYAFDPNGSIKWECSFARLFKGAAPFATAIGGVPAASPVVGPDGTIYQTLAGDPNLYAVNPDDGSIVWASRMTAYSEAITQYSGIINDAWLTANCSAWFGIAPTDWYDYYWSSGWSEPAIGPDGTIYVTMDDPYLRAVDPNGTIKWVTPLGTGVGLDIAVGADGYIYAAGADGRLYVVNADGVPVSCFDAGDMIGFPVIAADGTIIVSSMRDNSMLKEQPGNTVWAISSLVRGQQAALNIIADLNGDGVIDAADLALLADDWLDKEDKKPEKGQAGLQREIRDSSSIRPAKGSR